MSTSSTGKCFTATFEKKTLPINSVECFCKVNTNYALFLFRLIISSFQIRDCAKSNSVRSGSINFCNSFSHLAASSWEIFFGMHYWDRLFWSQLLFWQLFWVVILLVLFKRFLASFFPFGVYNKRPSAHYVSNFCCQTLLLMMANKSIIGCSFLEQQIFFNLISGTLFN